MNTPFHLLIHRCNVLRRKASQGPTGGAAHEPKPHLSDVPCRVTFGAGGEEQRDGGTRTTESGQMIVAPGLDLRSDDIIEWNGVRYEIKNLPINQDAMGVLTTILIERAS